MASLEPTPASDESDWQDALPTAGLRLGHVVEVVLGDRVLALGLTEAGYFALDGVCAHQGGPLGRGCLSGQVLTCPWHGWQYDTQTGQQVLSEQIAQSVYATRVVGDTIQVRRHPD